MKHERSYLLWVPRNGSGRTRHFLVRPSFLKILVFTVGICICSVPVLESGIITLNTKVTELEQRKKKLLDEIMSLKYLRRELANIEEKDRALRGYFGMDRYQSLEQVAGKGGTPGTNMVKADSYHLALINEPGNEPKPPEKGLPEKLQTLRSNLEIFLALSKKRDHAWEYTPNIIPVEMTEPKISSGFGWRKNPFTQRREFHVGIDIIGPKGTRIIAPASGLVITRGYDRWLGNYLVLQHTEELKTIYGHLNRTVVEEGEKVKRGDVIGLMGNSGLSTSNHLHYAVIHNDRAANPMIYVLDVRGMDGSG